MIQKIKFQIDENQLIFTFDCVPNTYHYKPNAVIIIMTILIHVFSTFVYTICKT